MHNNREGYPKGKEVEGYFLDGRHRVLGGFTGLGICVWAEDVVGSRWKFT